MGLVIISLDKKEQEAQCLCDESMRDAMLALHRDGVVAFENAVDLGHVDTLNARMLEDIPEYLRRTTTKYDPNAGGNISQTPPLLPGFMYHDIYDNIFAIAVISNILGPNLEMRYLRGNTAISHATGRQAVHADANFDHVKFPFGFVVNVMMVDTTPANGSTEMWLGTHTHTTIADHNAPDVGTIKESLVEERCKLHPPIYPSMKRGTLIVRDLRMWHAGMANSTAIPRIMLAMVYFPVWYHNHRRVTLAKCAQAYVSQFKNAKIIADYKEDDRYDYFTLNEGADFSSTYQIGASA